MEIDKLMAGIAKEMTVALKAMSKAKTADEKRVYSEIVKNLSESLGVFLGLMNEMAYMEDEYDNEDDSTPF